MIEEQAKAARQPHHECIDSAIERLNLVYNQLENLVNLIKAESNPNAPTAETSKISLASLLENGGDRINSKVDSMVDKIDELNRLLF